MGNIVSEQLAMFLRSILLGASMALVYDLTRLLRRLGGRVWGGILDAAYCVSVSVSLFLFVMAGDGELRLFFLLGAAGGAVLFFCLLSPLLTPLWELWLEIFLAPVRLAEGILKKCGKFFKKLFSFWKNWFTITVVTRWRNKKAPPPEGDGEMETGTNKKSKKKPRKRASKKLTLFLLVLLLIGIAVQLRSIRSEIQDAQAQEAAYAEELARLQEENARLAEDIAHSSDPALIEEIARNELGMVGEGEKIFRFQ